MLTDIKDILKYSWHVQEPMACILNGLTELVKLYGRHAQTLYGINKVFHYVYPTPS